ncbi:extracellular solute-binding protein [Paenibacillus cisolokensis]|uniref:extracellular solute-binding protein n=1 Tax=Paenibacillus cisolokensis TaxID=1658519 RepID=UPI003D2D61EB
MQQMKKRYAILLSAFLTLVLVLSACGGTAGNGGGQSGSGSQQAGSGGSAGNSGSSGAEPVNITIMSHFFNTTPPAADNPVELEIEKATNTKLDIQWVSSNNYGDKFNVTLSSGKMPDLILVNDPFNPVFLRAAKQNAFWDVSPFIQDYPNITAGIPDIAWELTKIDGANYGVPRPRPAEGEAFFVFRKDWLDNLGLDAPQTADELYAVMKAFVEDDPDGNGKRDTVAFAGQVNASDMGTLARFEQFFTKSTGEWALRDGELVFTALLPETREALEYLNRAYHDGLIPADFASLKLTQVKDMFKAGTAGIIVEKAGTMQEYYEALKAADPNFEFMNLLPIVQIDGYNPKGPGFAGINAIPRSVPEEKLKAILQMINDWMEEDVFLLHSQGIEGVHHKVENGEIVIDSEKVLADGIGDFNQIVYVADPYASSVKTTFPEEVQQLYKQIQDERARTSVADFSLGLYSETALAYLPELRKNQQDLKTKVILGSASLEEWDKFVEQLSNDPSFIKMTEEINESYKARNS